MLLFSILLLVNGATEYIFIYFKSIKYFICFLSHSLINNLSYLNILYTYRWDKQSTDQFNKFIIFFVLFFFIFFSFFLFLLHFIKVMINRACKYCDIVICFFFLFYFVIFAYCLDLGGMSQTFRFSLCRILDSFFYITLVLIVPLNCVFCCVKWNEQSKYID